MNMFARKTWCSAWSNWLY